MEISAKTNLGYVVRAGESYKGKQGPNYTPGISAETVGARALWLGSVTLPPGGGPRRTFMSTMSPPST